MPIFRHTQIWLVMVNMVTTRQWIAIKSMMVNNGFNDRIWLIMVNHWVNQRICSYTSVLELFGYQPCSHHIWVCLKVEDTPQNGRCNREYLDRSWDFCVPNSRANPHGYGSKPRYSGLNDKTVSCWWFWMFISHADGKWPIPIPQLQCVRLCRFPLQSSIWPESRTLGAPCNSCACASGPFLDRQACNRNVDMLLCVQMCAGTLPMCTCLPMVWLEDHSMPWPESQLLAASDGDGGLLSGTLIAVFWHVPLITPAVAWILSHSLYQIFFEMMF